MAKVIKKPLKEEKEQSEKEVKKPELNEEEKEDIPSWGKKIMQTLEKLTEETPPEAGAVQKVPLPPVPEEEEVEELEEQEEQEEQEEKPKKKGFLNWLL